MPHYSMLPHSVREAIRQARAEQGWTQTEAGQRAGLTQKHLSDIERGKLMPRFDTLYELLLALGLDLVLVPRTLTPTVNALVHDLTNPDGQSALQAPVFSSEAYRDG